MYLSALEHDLVRWPLVRARLELAYGSWLRRQRRPHEARAPLRSAQGTLQGIGAETRVGRARSELRAARAAEGLSNGEIAERLSMSHRTVGAHLRRNSSQLDITSRIQLAAIISSQA